MRSARRFQRYPRRQRPNTRARRRGLYTRLGIVGGAVPVPPVTGLTIYPYQGGGYNPSV